MESNYNKVALDLATARLANAIQAEYHAPSANRIVKKGASLYVVLGRK